MNKDQVKGTLKVAVGKTQKAVGEVVGSNKQKVAGTAKVVEGNVQKAVGDVKELATSVSNHKR